MLTCKVTCGVWSPPHPHDCWCFYCLPPFAVALWVFGGNPHKWAVTTLGWRQCAKGYLGAPRFGKNLEVQLRKGQLLWPCPLLAARIVCTLWWLTFSSKVPGLCALGCTRARSEDWSQPFIVRGVAVFQNTLSLEREHQYWAGQKKWPLSTTSVAVRFPLLPRLGALCSSHWNCLWGTVHQPNPLAPTTRYLFPPHFLSVELWPAQGERWWSCC